MDVGYVKQIGLVHQTTTKCLKGLEFLVFSYLLCINCRKLQNKKFSPRILANVLKRTVTENQLVNMLNIFQSIIVFPRIEITYMRVVQRIFLYSVKRRYKITKNSQLTCFIGADSRLRSACAAPVRVFLGTSLSVRFFTEFVTEPAVRSSLSQL